MIVTENMSINGKAFVRTYSDNGYKVERGGILYDEAIDPADANRAYKESAEPVEGMDETEEKAAAFDILMGVSE